jgi:hypothetical protein
MNELLGDDLLGDDLAGDELLGDDLAGDELLGDDLLGDEILGDDLAGDEILGADLIAGDEIGGDEILGAWRRRQRQRKGRALGQMRSLQKARTIQAVQSMQNAQTRKNLIRNAILAKKIEGSKVLESKRPTHSRVQSMGLSLAAVQPGATVDIIARPQEIFRGRRLVIPSTIAQFFMVEDVKVGRTSQFVSSGRQPALVFSELSTGDNLSLKTCSPGMDIVLKVTNISEEEINFDSALIGDVVE